MVHPRPIRTTDHPTNTNTYSMRTKTLLISALASVIILSVVVLLAVPWDWPCKPTTIKPLVSEMPDQISLYSSSDYRALARMRGYLNFSVDTDVDGRPSSEVYVPFELKGVQHIVRSFRDEHIIKVLFMTNCCSITMNMLEVNGTIRAKRTTVSYRHDYSGNNRQQEEPSCVIGGPNDWSFNVNSHYACYNDLYFECRQDSAAEMLVGVHLQVFEFEVEGQKDYIARGRFSKPISWCEVNE